MSEKETMSVTTKKPLFTTKNLVRIALLSGIAVILQMFDFPIPIFPPFYKLDFSDVPAIIAAVLVSPFAGVFVELIKNIIHMLRTDSAFVGEFANFLIGAALVLPIGIVCRKNKTTKNFIFSIIVGIATMAIFGAFLNAFVLLPLYATLYNMQVSDFVAMSTAIFPFIDTLPKFILLTVIPFNLFKGVVVGFVSVLLYGFLSKSVYVSK